MKLRRRHAGIVMAVVFVAAGCGSDDTSGTDSADVQGPSAEAPGEEPSDSEGDVPSFRFTVQQGADELGAPAGEEIEFASLVGRSTPIILNFWAGLCPPCRAEMPWFQSAVDEHEDGVLLFGLDVGPHINLGSQEDGRALLDELDITYPTGVALDPSVVADYNVSSMPTTVFIDGDGQILDNHAGILTEEQIQDWLATLASE